MPRVYEQCTGAVSDGYTILEISYSLGLSVGIILFFNHFAGKKITMDPTPLEVQMKQAVRAGRQHGDHPGKQPKGERSAMGWTILLAISGFSAGTVVAGGIFALIVGLKIVPRFVGFTHTAHHMML